MVFHGVWAIEIDSSLVPVQICLTLDQCKERIDCNLGKYCCCPNGTKKTEYKCLAGTTFSDATGAGNYEVDTNFCD